MWQYFWVFLGAFFVDVVPLPLPPAFTVMVFLQIHYNLDTWMVIVIGVLGSILGRYILFLYIPHLSARIFNAAKNNEVQFLGRKLRERGLKGQLSILLYSLMPLPTTPLFIAGGMAKLKPLYIMIPFIIGKFISDAISVLLGKYAAVNTTELINGLVSWKSISGFVAGLLLIFMFVFIDWTNLIANRKFQLRFKVMK